MIIQLRHMEQLTRSLTDVQIEGLRFVESHVLIKKSKPQHNSGDNDAE
jgi:hypothetical protein